MNVLIVLVTSTAGLSGVQRHALNLAACLLQREDLGEIHLAVAPWQQELVAGYGLSDPRLRVHVADIRCGVLARNAWFYFGLPRLARKVAVDLVHVSYPVPLRRRAFKAPVVVTLHDLYPFEAPQNFGRTKAAFHRAIVRECLGAVDAVTCVSEATAQALARYLPSHFSPKVSVIYNCVGRLTALPAPPPEVAAREPFLLSVAQHRHNKNIPLLLCIFRRLLTSGSLSSTASLLIVGMRGPETRRIEELITSLELSGRVALLESISDSELRWCYDHCDALVVPSMTEGFCLPVAEALLAGCRLVCSDIPVLREIAGNRCVFVPLNSDSERIFSDAISAMLRLPRPMPVPLPQLSIESIGAQYAAIYHRIAAKVSSGRTQVSLGKQRSLPQEGAAP